MNVTGFAALFEVAEDTYQARILLDGDTKPIEFLGRGPWKEIAEMVRATYPHVEIQTKCRFLAEMDFIHTNGHRSGCDHFELPEASLVEEQ